MIDIVEDPDMIMNLREGDVVLAHGHMYQVKSINYKERIYFDRCDNHWLKSRVSPERYESEQCHEYDDTYRQYADTYRHIRTPDGDAAMLREEWVELITNPLTSFNA